jgi:DnaK suppressor protein
MVALVIGKESLMASRLTDSQIDELRELLTDERERLLASGKADLEEAKAGGERSVGDDVDQSNEDGALALTARFRERDRRLLRKVDHALSRMEQGEYDLCELTGDPIGYERLKFRPVTTLSIAAKEEAERHESEYIE